MITALRGCNAPGKQNIQFVVEGVEIVTDWLEEAKRGYVYA
jgi:hypothetical protein